MPAGVRVAEPARPGRRPRVDRRRVEQGPEQPLEVAHVGGIELRDRAEQDAGTGVERMLGELATAGASHTSARRPSEGSDSRWARPAASSRSTTRTARECETRIASASTSTDLPSAHSASDTKAAGRPPAIPVAASVASLMPSLSVRAMAPSRLATCAICASGI